MSKARNLAALLGGGTTGVVEFSGTGAIKAPGGTTAQRPTPANGQLRYNSDLGAMEVYAGDAWGTIAPPPTIQSVSPTTYSGEQGTTFTITGANFGADATVKFVTNNGTEYAAASVTRVSGTQLTATTPQDFTVAQEPLSIKVIQGSGSITLSSAIDCGGTPTWVTAAGSLVTTSQWNSPVSTAVSASDPDSGATVTYAITSGSLPSGLTLNTSTGAITGTASNQATTTYNFTVTATDNAGNQTARSFSMTITNAAPTWSSPASGAALSASLNTSFSQSLSASDPESQSITYSLVSGTLPTGITLSGSSISGVPTAELASNNIVVAASDGYTSTNRTFSISCASWYPTSGLIQMYDFAGGNSWSSGSTVTDRSSAGQNGTWSGVTPTYSSSEKGGYASIPTGSSGTLSASTSKSASMTFAAYLKANVGGMLPDKMLFCAGPSGSGPDVYFSGTQYAWNTWDGVMNAFGTFDSSWEGTWQLYIVVLTSGGYAQFFRNGSLVGQATYKSVTASNQYYPLGCDSFLIGGKVNWLAVWNRALNTTEISNLYTALNAR